MGDQDIGSCFRIAAPLAAVFDPGGIAVTGSSGGDHQTVMRESAVFFFEFFHGNEVHHRLVGGEVARHVDDLSGDPFPVGIHLFLDPGLDSIDLFAQDQTDDDLGDDITRQTAGDPPAGALQVDTDSRSGSGADEHGDNAFSLDAGDNLLNGEKAEIFVRYRKGYALGDLARIDAQKIFISGLYKTITERIGYSEILRVIAVASDGVITDFSVSDIISMLFNKKGSIDGITLKYVTLPGEALQDESGLWYYVLNKKSATEVVEKYLMVENADFDTNNVFVKKDNMLFNNIYDDQNFKYKEYTDDSIKDMNIIKQ